VRGRQRSGEQVEDPAVEGKRDGGPHRDRSDCGENSPPQLFQMLDERRFLAMLKPARQPRHGITA